jgi:hypothetical protein
MGNQMIKKFIIKLLGLNTTREDLVRLQELLNEAHELAVISKAYYDANVQHINMIPTCSPEELAIILKIQAANQANYNVRVSTHAISIIGEILKIQIRRL